SLDIGALLGQVRTVSGPFGRDHAGQKIVRVFAHDMRLLDRYRWGVADPRRGTKHAIGVSEHHAEFGVAKLRRLFQHGLEYGFQVAWRTADYLQNIGSRRLTLQ